MHQVWDLHGVKPFFQHRASHFGIISHNRHRTRRNVELIGFQLCCAQVVVRRYNVVQDLFDIEHQRQIVSLFVVVQTGDTGNVATIDGFLGGMHLLPVQTHNVFYRLHRKRLNAAGIFRDQQDVESGLWLTARDGGQINHRDHLIANVNHTQQRGFHTCGTRKGRHRYDFTQFEYVDAKQF